MESTQGLHLVFNLLFSILGRTQSMVQTLPPFITQASIKCPENTSLPAEINILTDIIENQPYIVCKSGYRFNLQPVKTGTWTTHAYFDRKTNESCIFNRKANSNTYIINAFVPLTGGIILEQTEPYVMTCSFDDHLTGETPSTAFSNSKRPIVHVLQNKGVEGNSTIDLYMSDINDTRSSGHIQIGRLVQLRAHFKSTSRQEVGFQPIHCEAVGRFSNYPILVSGCGDGMVLPRTTGFTTVGTHTDSPYFRVFKMLATEHLVFNCTFVLCTTNCDGNSCNFVSSGHPSTSQVADR